MVNTVVSCIKGQTKCREFSRVIGVEKSLENSIARIPYLPAAAYYGSRISLGLLNSEILQKGRESAFIAH